MLKIAGILISALAVTGFAQASELHPLQAQPIALGAVNGVAYYTETAHGYEIVATLAAGEGGAPMRFVATLMSGQRVLLSVPQSVDEPAVEIEFARVGDAMVVSSAPVLAKLD